MHLLNLTQSTLQVLLFVSPHVYLYLLSIILILYPLANLISTFQRYRIRAHQTQASKAMSAYFCYNFQQILYYILYSFLSNSFI
jgi:hypothetical protein